MQVLGFWFLDRVRVEGLLLLVSVVKVARKRETCRLKNYDSVFIYLCGVYCLCSGAHPSLKAQ